MPNEKNILFFLPGNNSFKDRAAALLRVTASNEKLFMKFCVR